MARISTAQGRIGIIPGATWGTAVAITGAQLIHGRYTLANARGEFSPPDVGFSNFVREIVKLEESVDITLTGRMRFGDALWQAVAHFLANDTATETTVGQGDYAHVMKMQESNDGEFTTLAASYGTLANDILEFPSVKWHTLNISGAANDVPEISVSGMADRVVLSGATNALTNLTGASYLDDVNYGVLGGANHYFRMNAASGAGLASGDNKNIMNFQLQMSRPLSRDYTLRGADTRYTLEPGQLAPATGTLTVQFHQILASHIDLLSIWNNSTKQKGELYLDGAVIGSGVNRGVKIQLPALDPAGPLPSGFDLPNNNSRMQPAITFNLLEAIAAPTGMTGITAPVNVTVTNTRATAYT